MKYLLLITNHADQVAEWEKLSEEEAAQARAEEMPAWGELFGWIEQKGLDVEGLELESPRDAKTVRVRDGEVIVTDGPYAETKEQIGGYFVAECDQLDDAIELAERIPSARHASIEIRPLVAHEEAAG
jgi:hypothetical protein